MMRKNLLSLSFLFASFGLALEPSELLIAYGTLNTVYVQNSNDPSNAYLKQFGYNFGDRIVAK